MLSFRYPVATILLMSLIACIILVILDFAQQTITLSAPIALYLAISYLAALIIWAVLFALGRAGAQRLEATETWPAKR